MSRFQHYGGILHVATRYFIVVFLWVGCLANSDSFAAEPTTSSEARSLRVAEDIPNLICFWDFQDHGDGDLTSRGPHHYRLTEMNGPIQRATKSALEEYSAVSPSTAGR